MLGFIETANLKRFDIYINVCHFNASHHVGSKFLMALFVSIFPLKNIFNVFYIVYYIILPISVLKN